MTLLPEPPALGDDRLRLRPWRVDDAEALVAAWHDPDIVAGSTPPDDRSPDAARRWIEGTGERWSAGIAADLVIADAGDDRVVGEIGLSRFDVRRRAAMIGWWVAAEARGAGVAGTALGWVAGWALHPDRLAALVAEIGAGNVASQRVAARAGFAERRPASADRPGVWIRQAG